MTPHLSSAAPLRTSVLTALGLAVIALTGTGCGPNCYTACGKLYQEECNITAPGQSQSELLDECVDTCQDALTTPGDLDGYNPFEPTSSSSAIEITNDRQAAVWMDCVDQSSCQKIQGDLDGDGETDTQKMCLPHF